MDFVQTFLDWEVKHKLFEVGHVDGFAFYSFMRRDLLNSALNKTQEITMDPFAAKGQEDTGLKLFAKLLKHSMKPPVKQADMLILCHPRRNKTGDVYESVFTDYLEEEFPNSLTLERLFDNHSHFEPAKTQNICYIDRIVLKSYVGRILASKFKKKEYAGVRNRIKEIMEGPLKDLEEIFRIDIEAKKYYERGVTMYYFYKIRKPAYVKFLRQVKPKVLVEVVSKSVDAMLINELCKDMGIPVVEIQHSLLGPIAIYPEGIYEKQSPEYYLSYSDYWSEYQKYPIPAERVFTCGSPYFERQVNAYRKPRTEREDGKKQVLFISGMAYGKDLAKVAVDLKKAAGDKVDIIYKLHPDEFGSWREMYPALVEEGIRVVDSKDISIYEFFNDADAQVGVFSTAIYEGMAFNTRTFILDIPFAAEFIDLCKAGYGTLIRDGGELAEAVLNEESGADLSALSEKFWASDARANVVKTLKAICPDLEK